MPFSHRFDSHDTTRFNGLFRRDGEAEWLIVRRLGLPETFDSADAAEAAAIRQLEVEEMAIQPGRRLFADLLGVWIAGFVGEGSTPPPAPQWLARFVAEQFLSPAPFGLPVPKWDDRVQSVPTEWHGPLQFWLLCFSVQLLQSELAASCNKTLADDMANAVAGIDMKSAWGNFKLGHGIAERLRKMKHLQDAWDAAPDRSAGPGYGSPAWCAAVAYLVLDASSPYFGGRESPSDAVFDAVVCAFSELEDDISPIIRHFVRACQESFATNSKTH